MTSEPWVVVNGDRFGLPDVLRSARVSDGLRMYEDFARQRLIEQLARREGVSVDEDVVQKAVDDWRYRNHLESVDDTEAWLASRGVTLEDVAEQLECGLLEDGLARRVTEGRVDRYFAEHRLDFDEAEVYRILASDRDVAAEIRDQVADEGEDFYLLARLYSEDDDSRPAGGYVGRLRRRDLPKGVAPLVFAGNPGDTVGPLKVPDGHALYLVREVYRAALDDTVREEIQKRLFSEWMRRGLQSADIAFPFMERQVESGVDA